MLNIPQLTGLFEPQPYVAPKDALENNIATVGAMQDPSGTLERMHAEQIAKTMADLKMEGVDAKYKGLALDAITEYQQKSMDLYKGNKGFNQLNLDGKQLLQESANYKGLLGNVNALKELTTINRKALEDVDNMMYQQILTPEDRNKFMAEIDLAEKNAKTIEDLPNYRAKLVNFMSARPQKAVAGMYKTPETWADLGNKPQTGERADQYDIKQAKDQILIQFGSGEWQQSTRPMLYQTGILKKGMTSGEELDAATAYMQSRFNPAENRKGGTTINMPGDESKFSPVSRMTEPDGTYSWSFNDKPVNLKSGDAIGTVGEVRYNPVTKVWTKKVSQVQNEKGETVIPDDDPNSKIFKFLVGSGIKRDAIHRGYYIEEMNPNDVDAIVRSKLKLKDSEKYGMKSLSTVRTVKDEPKTTTHTVKKYEYDGELYSYEELVNAGVDVKKQMDEGTVKVKK